MPTGFRPAFKVALSYLVFMTLFGAYKLWPVFPLSIICGTNESNFQHYKATFFSFLIVGLVEFLLYREKIKRSDLFWYPRLFSATMAPWPVFLLWYIVPAVYGRLPGEVLEIVYANITTFASFVCVVFLEGRFLALVYDRNMKILVWALFLVSALLYIVFTFSHLPWADVFIEPQWR